MRVAIVGPAYPLRGGIAHHVYSLYRELESRGHTVQVISFKRLYPRLLFPGKTTLDSTSSLRLDAAALPILDPVDPRTWIQAFRSIIDFGAEVILIQWWNPIFGPLVGSLGLLLRRGNRQVVIECHNVVPHEPTLLDPLLTGLALVTANQFITHSIADREDLASLMPDARILVSGLPTANEFRSKATPERSGRTILFFGIIRRYKGLDVLLRAMREVVSRTKCKLIVAGEFYEDEEKYRQLVRDLGIESCVSIENRYLSNEEISVLFERADVLVLPYLTATQSAVAGIALANALPVIASKTGGLSEVIRDNENGLLVPPNDPGALAAALLRYFQQGLGPRLAASIAVTGRNSQSSPIVDLLETLARSQALG